MQRKSFSGWLLVFFLVVSLLLPLHWLAMAGPSLPLAQQVVPLQPATGFHGSPILEPASTTSETVLYPSDDATVQEGEPNSPDPDNFYLGAGYYQGFPYGADGRARSYIRFDLSGLPADSTIVSATLRLYHAGGADYPDQTRTVNLHRVTGNWNEAGVTWNNRPDYAEVLGSVTTTYNFQDWLNLDLTDQVRAWVGGSQTNYGFVAIGPEDTPGVYRVFASGETDHSPELRVRYLPPINPVLDAWPGNLLVRASSTQPLPASSLQVSNVTSGSLDWVATKVGGAAWLELSKSSGSATPTTPDSVIFTINPASLPSGTLTPGTYTEQIRISSSTPGVAGSPLTVTFTLEVVDYLSNIYLPLVSVDGAVNPPNIVALIVGIADYQHASPSPVSGKLPDDWGTGNLAFPGFDGDDIQEICINKFGVPPEKVIRLGDTGHTQTGATTMLGELGAYSGQQSYPLATRANVIAAFGQLDDLEDKDTIVVFYFSGHGGQTLDGNGDESDGYDEFIAMYDTDTGPGGFINVLTDDDLQALLANLESRHIVAIIDSCYSGSLVDATMQLPSDLQQRGLMNNFKSNANAIQDTQAALAELAGPGRVIITAGTDDQATWESSALENGVFTYFFLQSLEDTLSDANQNSRISAEEAYWFSKDLVINYISTITDTPQIPDIGDQYFGQIDLTWLP